MAKKAASNKTVKAVEGQEANGKSLKERLSILDSLCAEATKQGLALAGRVTVPEVRDRLTIKYIPTPSNDINTALGGGFPRGRISIVTGLQDSGKTFLILETIAKAMKENPDITCVWIETENSVDKSVMSTVGIDMNRCFFFAQNKESGGEGVTDLLTTVLNSDVRPDIVVLNSLKMLVPKSEINKSMDKISVAEQARFNTRLMNKIVPSLAENDTAMIIVQALSTDIGTLYGDNKALSGGLSIRYNASIMVDLRKMSIQDSDPIKKEDGMKIKLTVKKNHCITDRFPYVSLEYFVEYGKGIEQILSTLKLLIDKNILVQKGAWIYYLDSNGEKQEGWSWQGKSAFKADMEEHPDKLKQLVELLNGETSIHNLSDEEIAEIEAQEKNDAEAILSSQNPT